MRKVIILLCILIGDLYSITLTYNYDEDYRIEAKVYQNVQHNNKIILSSIILNRYIVDVVSNDGNHANLNITQSIFQDSKGLTTGYYVKQDIKKANIVQNRIGQIIQSNQTYFPEVQGVPVFPNRDIQIGESWISEGREFFNLQNSFGINDVITVYFNVFYTLESVDNSGIAKISVSYNYTGDVFPEMDWPSFYPTKIDISSKQQLYWDTTKGRVSDLNDEYRLKFNLSDGSEIIFKGNTISKSKPREDLLKDKYIAIEEDLRDTAVVTKTEDSLKITFESMLFDPEDWRLKESVKSYLDRIGRVLSDDINIRISGHTALLPDTDKKYVKDLSLKRAYSVAKYLVDRGYIKKENIEISGFGGDLPISTNKTSLGRSKNRRVEIDILSNE